MIKQESKIRERKVIKELKGIIRTQVPERIGIKKYEETEITAMFKQLKQLNVGAVEKLNNPANTPIDPKTLTDEEKERALSAVNLIKEKRDEQTKGRTRTDGSRQKQHLSEQDTVAAPKQTLDGLSTTRTIDAKERRSVIMHDIPGAF